MLFFRKLFSKSYDIRHAEQKSLCQSNLRACLIGIFDSTQACFITFYLDSL